MFGGAVKIQGMRSVLKLSKTLTVEAIFAATSGFYHIGSHIMCGRFTLSQSPESLEAAFRLPTVPAIPPSYNIAPSQPVPVVRQPGEVADRELTFLLWGLVPSWSKDPKMGSRLINARAETVTEKPAFRSAFKRRRCLVVADGFYEWQRSDGQKQPFYFCIDDRQPFGFAGLWEHWEGGDGSVIESCTILTTAANEVLRPIHDRMPVILPPDQYDLWLDSSIQAADRLLPLLKPYEPTQMQAYPVSPKVNSPRYDSPDCIQPLEAV